VPTGKTLADKNRQEELKVPLPEEDSLLNMDDDKLKLIWRRMYNGALSTNGDKIQRRDFLERIFQESELKDFYELINEPIMDDFVAF